MEAPVEMTPRVDTEAQSMAAVMHAPEGPDRDAALTAHRAKFGEPGPEEPEPEPVPGSQYK